MLFPEYESVYCDDDVTLLARLDGVQVRPGGGGGGVAASRRFMPRLPAPGRADARAPGDQARRED